MVTPGLRVSGSQQKAVLQHSWRVHNRSTAARIGDQKRKEWTGNARPVDEVGGRTSQLKISPCDDLMPPHSRSTHSISKHKRIPPPKSILYSRLEADEPRSTCIPPILIKTDAPNSSIRKCALQPLPLLTSEWDDSKIFVELATPASDNNPPLLDFDLFVSSRNFLGAQEERQRR
ncbi:hypothetical protein B296_00018624 [Ensete ventricosum]|uniref:Uncharacterized protein n=1 Tax=Ensete ventricosum TaxID=4639 RepID=A0A426Z851_ENSVE|nr:hypothetical protein B296_00018624 [Ensete ventricosum]